MTDHANLPPSSAKEWGNCDAWLRLNEASPEPPESDAAAWGNEAHELARRMIESHARGGTQYPERVDDDEMWRTAEIYANHCKGLMQSTSVFGGEALGVEQRLDMPTVSREVWGTADFYIWHAQSRTLYVRDFKTGYLVVEPDDPQLQLYAVGVASKLCLRGERFTVNLGVVQPRAFHRLGPVRTVTIDGIDLITNVAAGLRTRAEANLARDGQAQAGPHCRNCIARSRCPAAIAAGPELLNVVAEGVPTEPTPAELGTLLSWTKRAIKHLEQMAKAYEGEIEAHLRSGAIVPGWSLEPSQGRKDWTVPRDQVLQLGKLFGVDLDKPGTVTPTQARDLGIPEEIIIGYCTRKQSGVKLTEAGDLAASVFQPKKGA